MRKTYRVLGYVLAAEVVVQAMMIAFALAGLGHWIESEGGVVNKQVFDDNSAKFTGVVGFMIHGINGELLIPLLTIALLVVSLRAGVPGGTRRAGIIFGLVVLQVVLGFGLHGVPYLALLHALNAFGIFAMAVVAARAASQTAPASVAGSLAGSVTIPGQAAPVTQDRTSSV